MVLSVQVVQELQAFLQKSETQVQESIGGHHLRTNLEYSMV